MTKRIALALSVATLTLGLKIRKIARFIEAREQIIESLSLA